MDAEGPCAQERPPGAVLKDTLFAGLPHGAVSTLPRRTGHTSCLGAHVRQASYPLPFLPPVQPPLPASHRGCSQLKNPGLQCPQEAPHSASERMQCAGQVCLGTAGRGSPKPGPPPPPQGSSPISAPQLCPSSPGVPAPPQMPSPPVLRAPRSPSAHHWM